MTRPLTTSKDFQQGMKAGARMARQRIIYGLLWNFFSARDIDAVQKYIAEQKAKGKGKK